MITRIVKLPIAPNTPQGESFEALFERYKAAIASAEGCLEVQLLGSKGHYFTYSLWLSEEHLNNYRHSAVFGEVWPQTKALFSGAPEAWTCHLLERQTP